VIVGCHVTSYDCYESGICLPVSAGMRVQLLQERAFGVQAAANDSDMDAFALTPASKAVGKENGTGDKLEEELKAMKETDALQSCHLVQHSESQGFYIPLEMQHPLHCEKTHPDLKILGVLSVATAAFDGLHPVWTLAVTSSSALAAKLCA
jgi:hypothetical protein